MAKDENLAYLEDVQRPVGDNAMAQLQGLAEEQSSAEAEVLRLEQELEKARKKLADVQEHRLPELMKELGLKTFETATGLKIKIKESIHAGISKEREATAFAWLDANGAGKLIKRQFICSFGKEDEAWAKKFARDLAQRKKKVDVIEKKSVHPSTLRVFVAEQLEKGVDIPLETFGVHIRRSAEITR